MEKPSLITLTTDFGTRDGYVGAMLGVISAIAPVAHVHHITHELPAFDVFAGAYCLANAVPYFPEGAIHIGVVDPGVGSKRKAVIIDTGREYFVGPDNGLFSFAIGGRQTKAWEIHYAGSPFERKGSTFDGRDLFAPAAARLAAGANPEELGEPCDGPMTLEFTHPDTDDGVISCKVVYVDSFGNCITNVTKPVFDEVFHQDREVAVSGDGFTIYGIVDHYAQSEQEQPMALFSSADFLEIALNRGSAAKSLSLTRGSTIEIKHQ